MNNRPLSLVALCMLLPFSALAQKGGDKPALTAKQVMEAAVAALGGQASLQLPKSLSIVGAVEMPDAGVTGDLTIKLKGKKTLFTANFSGLGVMRSGFDGKVKWEEDPFNGLHKTSAKEDPKVKPGEEDPGLLYSSFFDIPDEIFHRGVGFPFSLCEP